MEEQDERKAQGPPQRSRLEDEVLEILYRVDQPASFTDHLRRKASRQRRERWSAIGDRFGGGRRAGALGAGSYLIGSFAVALLAVLLRDASALLATILAMASVALLVWPIVDRYRRPQPPEIKRWRGRDIDLNPPPAWLRALQDRFRRPPRR